MKFIQELNSELEEWFLLKHPFYQAWSAGQLSRESLEIYAKEYYHHVAAFPRYISQIHAKCDNIQDRQILLENLIDEEQGNENHPELWLRFLEGISGSRVINNSPDLQNTQNLVNGYFDLTKKDYATGLGALYAYERQTPEVAQSKISGLKEYYNVHDEETLKFFSVHQAADEWHTAELVGLLNKLSVEQQQDALQGAITGAKLLWGFLDEMYTQNNSCH